MEKPSVKLRYDNGNILLEEKHELEKGYLTIWYHENGKIAIKEIKNKKGQLHCVDGEAKISYAEDGDVLYSCYYINDEQVFLEYYDKCNIEKLLRLINQYDNENSLNELKLVVNIKFNKDKELLDLIDSRLIIYNMV